MKVYKIWMGKGCNPFCTNDLDDIEITVFNAEVGEIVKIEILEMTESEYNRLSEFTGP